MKFLTISMFIILFSSCGSQPKLEKQPPLGIGEVYFQEIVGGRQETAPKIKIFVPVEASEVTLDSVCFRNQKMPLQRETSTMYTATFSKSKNQDLNMHSEPVQEYGNSVNAQETVCGEGLAPNEAIISYRQNGKKRFFKIENIQERPAQYLPGRER